LAEPLIHGGYILLSRKLIESEIWFKPPLYIKVWIYLLSRAQHKEYKNLKIGELWTNVPEIQEACSWYVGFRKEVPSKKQIYSILGWLRNPHEEDNERNTKGTMIVTTKGTQGLLVTIENFNVYQTSKNYEGNNEGNNEKDTKELRREQEGNNINKNVKNDKNVKKNKKDIYISGDEEQLSIDESLKLDADKPKKEKYGEFEKVSLTEIEFNKLLDKLGQARTKDMIARLDTYKASKGKNYADDYATILNWNRKDIAEGKYKEQNGNKKSKETSGNVFLDMMHEEMEKEAQNK